MRDYKQVTIAVNGRGTRLRRVVSGSDLGTAKYQVNAGDLMISKIDARKGACALLQAELDQAIVTADFLSYEVNDQVADRGFIDLWVRRPSFAALCDQVSAGTTNRVRLDPARFGGIELALPPLDEQRRIVDLVGAVDDVIETTKVMVLRGRAALNLVRSTLPGATDRLTVALDDLVVMRSGPSWKAADESPVPTVGAQPVLGITNTPAGSRVVLDERKYVSGLPATVQLLDASSLVMIRTNGNRSRIGNVYRAAPEVEGYAVSAFQIAIRALDPKDRDFLYWYLGSSHVQDAITAAASGSTGLGNVAVGWLKQLAVPDLDAGERSQYTSLCEAAGAMVERGETELARLSGLRSSLLDGLLSGEHVIPESYDRALLVG